MNKSSLGDIDFWRTKVREASCALGAAVRRELPAGCWVTYTHGKHTVKVQVIEHNIFGDLKVRSDKGKEYWLSHWRITAKVTE